MAKQQKTRAVAENLKALQDIINKQHGDGSLMIGRGAIVQVDVFPTGIAAIDKALGVGGLPIGRTMELFGAESSGKTTTCLHFIAACQKYYFPQRERYGTAAFIDAEHAFDPDWAQKIGVDVESLLMSQPGSGEEAFQIADTMVRSKLVDLIVIDSVAALVPKAELEGEVGDSHIGAQARLMSQGMRKLCGICSKCRCSIIFINQIREKIGVMFGCLHGDTLIDFVDGRVLPIREVVENKIKGAVWTYNTINGQFEASEITDWHHNGNIDQPDDYLHFTLRGPGTKNGTMQITVTPSHNILTYGDFQWVAASELSEHDVLVTQQPCHVIHPQKGINGSVGEFLTGILSGDSHLSKNSKKIGASLKLRDNIDNEYVLWKVQKLRKRFEIAEYDCSGASGKKYLSYSSPEFFEFAMLKEQYPNRDPMLLLNNFSWLGFAVWVMDDAVFERNRYILSCKRFRGDFEKLDEISYKLDELELYHHMSKGGRITFDVETSKMIASYIACVVPPCMDHKLPSHFRGQYQDFELNGICDSMPTPVKILNIRYASNRQMRQKGKYDITVANNQCYMAGGNPNGVILHNSPETTPGGRAAKFYATIRAQISKGVAIKGFGSSDSDKGPTIGFRPKIKLIKNKVAAPFTQAEYEICVGHPQRPVYGIDMEASLLDVGREEKICSKTGNFYKFGDVTLGNGRGNALAKLREDTELAEQLKKQIYDRLFSRQHEEGTSEVHSDIDDEDLSEVIEEDE